MNKAQIIARQPINSVTPKKIGADYIIEERSMRHSFASLPARFFRIDARARRALNKLEDWEEEREQKGTKR